MSNLTKLLNIKGSLVDDAVAKFEDLSGFPNEDIRILSEIEVVARERIADLGMDPHDTTGQELYHALLARFSTDSTKLDAKLGLTPSMPAEKIAKKVAYFTSHADIQREVWALKPTAAKDLLRQHPPKRVMKLMCYRSLDSMLKRARLAEIYAALPYIESPRWQSSFKKLYIALSPQHFQLQPLKIVTMSSKTWSKGLPKNIAVTVVPQVGIVAVWPSAFSTQAGSLYLALNLFASIDSLRTQSILVKSLQFGDLGKILNMVWHEGSNVITDVAGLPIMWRSLQRYYGRLSAAAHPDIFEPHVQPEDLYWNEVSETLANLVPMLNWWSGGDNIAVAGKVRPISMNIEDVASNYAEHLPYKKRISEAFRTKLWDDLLHHYMMYPAVETSILDQLQQSMLSPIDSK
jgi:hypothetical protein